MRQSWVWASVWTAIPFLASAAEGDVPRSLLASSRAAIESGDAVLALADVLEASRRADKVYDEPAWQAAYDRARAAVYRQRIAEADALAAAGDPEAALQAVADLNDPYLFVGPSVAGVHVTFIEALARHGKAAWPQIEADWDAGRHLDAYIRARALVIAWRGPYMDGGPRCEKAGFWDCPPAEIDGRIDEWRRALVAEFAAKATVESAGTGSRFVYEGLAEWAGSGGGGRGPGQLASDLLGRIEVDPASTCAAEAALIARSWNAPRFRPAPALGPMRLRLDVCDAGERVDTREEQYVSGTESYEEVVGHTSTYTIGTTTWTQSYEETVTRQRDTYATSRSQRFDTVVTLRGSLIVDLDGAEVSSRFELVGGDTEHVQDGVGGTTPEARRAALLAKVADQRLEVEDQVRATLSGIYLTQARRALTEAHDVEAEDAYVAAYALHPIRAQEAVDWLAARYELPPALLHGVLIGNGYDPTTRFEHLTFDRWPSFDPRDPLNRKREPTEAAPLATACRAGDDRACASAAALYAEAWRYGQAADVSEVACRRSGQQCDATIGYQSQWEKNQRAGSVRPPYIEELVARIADLRDPACRARGGVLERGVCVGG